MAHQIKNVGRIFWLCLLGWSTTSGGNMSGTSRPSLGREVCALFIFEALHTSSKVWEYAWKCQTCSTSTRRRRPTYTCVSCTGSPHVSDVSEECQKTQPPLFHKTVPSTPKDFANKMSSWQMFARRNYKNRL